MLTATLGYGGSESDFLRLANELSRDMEVSIAVMALDCGDADYSNDHVATSLPIIVLDEGHSTGGTALVTKATRWWRMLRRLRGLKRQHDVTISFLSGPNLLNAAAGLPERTIVSERGSKLYHVGIGRFRKWLWLRVLDPWVYRHSAAVVPASSAYASEIREIGGPGVGCLIVPIEGSVDAAAMIADADAEPDPDIIAFCTESTAVFCGRLDHGKGIDLLVPEFARVRRAIPSARLLVIGDGPLKSTIVGLCEMYGLVVRDVPGAAADVYLAGYRRRPIRHFRLCKAFLFPSLHEGLSNALIEAVASGISVIAADCPWGTRSILGGGQESHDSAGTDSQRVLPFGLLMPVPDSSARLEMWSQEIESSLVGAIPRRSRDECMSAIKRFDLQVTRQEWKRLIEFVAHAASQ